MDKKLMDKVAMERLSEADKSAFRAAKKSGDSQMLGRAARVTAQNTPNIEASDVDKEAKRLGKSYYKQTYGSAEKNAESAAPAYKKTMNPAEKAKKSITFAAMERDLPQGGGKAMKIAKELEPDDAMKATIEKMMPGNKMKKTLGRMGKAGLVGGAVGLGINALMEGLDAEDAGSEEEKLDEVAMGQAMKTEAKIKADKAAMKPKSLPASTKKSYPTKEKVKALPQAVKKTAVEKRAPMPMGKSDEQKMEEFNQEGRRNIPDWKIEGMDEAVESAMRSEFKKAAKESNKKPLSTYMKK